MIILDINDLYNYVKSLATGDDSASIQINNDGKAIIRIGVTQTESITFEELCERIEEAPF